MILRMTITGAAEEWYAAVVTDNGGDKDWGPFRSREEALGTLRSMVEEAFDEDFDPAKVQEFT